MNQYHTKSHLRSISKYLNALISLAYPNLCIACTRQLLQHEKAICKICIERLPQTYFHKLPANPVEQIFWGRIEIQHATSLLFYRKGEQAQKILHAIKYKGNKQLAKSMGNLMGQAILQSNWYSSLNTVVPVPLHAKKQKMRGYNQSELLANELSVSLNLPINTHALVRQVFTSTQTRKNRYERYKNTEGVFEVVHPELFENKHILLIDDVITTGGTLEACAQTLLKIPGAKVSIATLAFAAM